MFKGWLLTIISGIVFLGCCNAQSLAIDRNKLDSLIIKAKEANSDGLYILQNGKVLVEEYFGNPVTPTYIASVGKALVSIAIIKLLNDGKIKSIDQPVADFYPEWRQGMKKNITLRMILSHTSGLQNEKNTRLEIETGPKGEGDDIVRLALAAELTDTPGTVYRYNNKAICLLPGIIHRASGVPMDEYFEKEFFKPMLVKSYRWRKDKAGTPHGHSAFDLLPADLAKFGVLMVNRGVYNGHRFFEERWVDSSITPSQQINPGIGLTWQLYRRTVHAASTIPFSSDQLLKLKTLGVADSVLAKLEPLANKTYPDKAAIEKDLALQFGPSWVTTLRKVAMRLPNGWKDLAAGESEAVKATVGYTHSGSWGNYLVVIPAANLVAVRLVKRDKEYNQEKDLFSEFTQRVFQLVYANW